LKVTGIALGIGGRLGAKGEARTMGRGRTQPRWLPLSVHPSKHPSAHTHRELLSSADPAFGGEVSDPRMRQDYCHETTCVNSFLFQSGSATRTHVLRFVAPFGTNPARHWSWHRSGR
jgi:hypothetical protein